MLLGPPPSAQARPHMSSRQASHHQSISNTPHDTPDPYSRLFAPRRHAASREQIARRDTSRVATAPARNATHTVRSAVALRQRMRLRWRPHATHSERTDRGPLHALAHTWRMRTCKARALATLSARASARSQAAKLTEMSPSHSLKDLRTGIGEKGTGRRKSSLHCRDRSGRGSGAARMGARGGGARSRERRAHRTSRTPFEAA